MVSTKNLRNLVAAFQSEFTDKENVCLIIKTIDLGLNKGIKKEIEKLPQLEGSGSVYIRAGRITRYSFAITLYRL